MLVWEVQPWALSILRDKVKKAGLDISVSNQAISNLQDTANTLIVTQEELADRAGQKPHELFM